MTRNEKLLSLLAGCESILDYKVAPHPNDDVPYFLLAESDYFVLADHIKECRELLAKGRKPMKKTKAAANPKGPMPRHKAMAMGKKIETGSKKGK